MVKDNLLELLHKVGELKKIRRTGWVREGIPNVESVSDHVFRVIFNTLIFGYKKRKLNFDKAIKMSIVHEIGEAIIGDIVWKRGGIVNPKAKEEKERLEKAAVKKLLDELKDGDELYKLWVEFEDNKTPEAQFVKQMDKLETAMQAFEYEHEYGKDLSEFFESSRPYFKDPEVLKVFNELLRKRK